MFVCVCKHFMCVCVFDQHDTSIWTEYVQCAYVCLCANRIRRHIMRLCGNQIKRMSVVFGFSHFWECFPTNHSCENGQDSGSDFSSLNPMLIFAIEIEF